MGASRAWLRAGTVRVRTTLAATAMVGIALAVGGLSLVLLLERGQTSALQAAAMTRATDIANLASAGTLPNPIAARADDSALVQVVDASGNVVAASENILGEPRLTPFVPSGGQGAAAVTLRDLPIGDSGASYRVVAMRTRAPEGARVVYVASSLESITATARQVAVSLIAGLPILLAFVAATTWLLVGRALRPVERIRSEVADITARDLSRRVPVPAAADEVARLARTMNAMLERLEGASERERGFVGDASHELRSPVAALRAQLEVAKGDGARAWTEADEEMLAETIRMENLIGNLLMLARADARSDRGSGASGVGAVLDLDDVVLDEVARARSSATKSVDVGAFEPARVRGDAKELGRVVRNLLENAQRHASSSVSVELLGSGNGKVRLVVADDGPGVPADQREHIFERFTRLDSARDRDHGGAGLGLAITRAVVRASGGDVTVEDRAGGGARFVVTLPRG